MQLLGAKLVHQRCNSIPHSFVDKKKEEMFDLGTTQCCNSHGALAHCI
jgi:hypothetical protein